MKGFSDRGGDLFPPRGAVAQKRQVYENDRQKRLSKGAERYLCRGMAESDRVHR